MASSRRCSSSEGTHHGRQIMSHRLGERWRPDVTRPGCLLSFQGYCMMRGLKYLTGMMEAGRINPAGNEDCGSGLTVVE